MQRCQPRSSAAVGTCAANTLVSPTNLTKGTFMSKAFVTITPSKLDSVTGGFTPPAPLDLSGPRPSFQPTFRPIPKPPNMGPY